MFGALARLGGFGDFGGEGGRELLDVVVFVADFVGEVGLFTVVGVLGQYRNGWKGCDDNWDAVNREGIYLAVSSLRKAFPKSFEKIWRVRFAEFKTNC